MAGEPGPCSFEGIGRNGQKWGWVLEKDLERWVQLEVSDSQGSDCLWFSNGVPLPHTSPGSTKDTGSAHYKWESQALHSLLSPPFSSCALSSQDMSR